MVLLLLEQNAHTRTEKTHIHTDTDTHRHTCAKRVPGDADSVAILCECDESVENGFVLADKTLRGQNKARSMQHAPMSPIPLLLCCGVRKWNLFRCGVNFHINRIVSATEHENNGLFFAAANQKEPRITGCRKVTH